MITLYLNTKTPNAYWIKNYNKKFKDLFCCFAIKKGGQVIGYFQFDYFIDKFIFIDYLIIDEKYRNRSKEIFDIVKKIINKTECKLILLESGQEINKHDLIIRLYKTLGFKKLEIDYVEPIITIDNGNIMWNDMLFINFKIKILKMFFKLTKIT